MTKINLSLIAIVWPCIIIIIVLPSRGSTSPTQFTRCENRSAS